MCNRTRVRYSYTIQLTLIHGIPLTVLSCSNPCLLAPSLVPPPHYSSTNNIEYYAHNRVFFLFCAFVLLIITSVSVPIWDSV